MNNRICVNGTYRDMSPEEIAAIETANQEAERQYWLNTPYDEAVNAEIRKRYSLSNELSIHRQRDEKQEEYDEYFAYCEECKTYVKQKKAQYGQGG